MAASLAAPFSGKKSSTFQKAGLQWYLQNAAGLLPKIHQAVANAVAESSCPGFV